MSPQDLIFKAQDSVPDGGMGHGIGFQPSGGCFYHCKPIVLSLESVCGCHIINLPGLPIFIFQPLSSIPKRLCTLGLLHCSACFTFMDNL